MIVAKMREYDKALYGEDTSEILNMESYEQVKWQRRLMIFTTALTIVCLVENEFIINVALF
jgi:hypothetical protein